MKEIENNKSALKNKTKEVVLDHEYDGIQELDNMLPRWWVNLFYITIAIALIYYVHYELGNGTSISQEFSTDLQNLEMISRKQALKTFPDLEKLAAVSQRQDSKTAGQHIFGARCVSCHGDSGQGLIGPNLTDHYWIHGEGKLASIALTIHDGVGEKGMPPWGSILSENEIYQVTTYVQSLRDSAPKNAKSPQGDLIKE